MAANRADLPARLVRAAALQLGDRALAARYREEWAASLPTRDPRRRWAYALSLFFLGAQATRREIHAPGRVLGLRATAGWMNTACAAAIMMPLILMRVSLRIVMPSDLFIELFGGVGCLLACLLIRPLLAWRPARWGVAWGVLLGLTLPSLLPTLVPFPTGLGPWVSISALPLGCSALVIGLCTAFPGRGGRTARFAYGAAAIVFVGQIVFTGVCSTINSIIDIRQVAIWGSGSDLWPYIPSALGYALIVAALSCGATRWAVPLGLLGGLIAAVVVEYDPSALQGGISPGYVGFVLTGVTAACAVAVVSSRRLPRTVRTIGAVAVFLQYPSFLLLPVSWLVSPARWVAHRCGLTGVHRAIEIFLGRHDPDRGWSGAFHSNPVGPFGDDLLNRILLVAALVLAGVLARAARAGVCLLRTTRPFTPGRSA